MWNALNAGGPEISVSTMNSRNDALHTVAAPAPECWGGQMGARYFSVGKGKKYVHFRTPQICAFWAENAFKYAMLKLKLCYVKLKKNAQTFAVLGIGTKYDTFSQ